MRKFAYIACFSLCFVMLATMAHAQDEEQPRRRRGGQGRQGRGMFGGNGALLVELADADHNDETTEAEWNAFVAKASGDDGVKVEQLRNQAFAHMMDADKNHKFEVADLQKLFTDMDQDESGSLEEQEMGRRRGGRRGGQQEGDRPRRRRGGQDGGGNNGDGGGDGGFRSVQPPAGDGEEGEQPRRRRGGQRGQQGRRNFDISSFVQRSVFRMVLAQADTDESRSVSAEEWTAFKGTLKTKGGVIADESIAKFMAEPEAPEGEEGGRRRRRMSPSRMINGMIGLDAEGGMSVEKLQGTFAKLDADSDKKVTKEERSARTGRGGDRGRGPVF